MFLIVQVVKLINSERRGNMTKPETMCDEVGCTREWVTEVHIKAPFAMFAPTSKTVMTVKVCQPCAEARHRNHYE